MQSASAECRAVRPMSMKKLIWAGTDTEVGNQLGQAVVTADRAASMACPMNRVLP